MQSIITLPLPCEVICIAALSAIGYFAPLLIIVRIYLGSVLVSLATGHVALFKFQYFNFSYLLLFTMILLDLLTRNSNPSN